ncbi:MAG: glycosyltransferase family 1 protein, partial [Acidimicrobiia bacterium]|nr:glycosyltransferase family 1 protein [Acidimicrobiia bacterium]
ALASIVDHPDEAARWSAAGRQQARTFGWDRAAAALAEGYRAAAPSPPDSGMAPVAK